MKSNRVGAAIAAALAAAFCLPAGGTMAAPERPAAGKVVRFQQGHWSGEPQAGPDGKVRQCLLVARRPRSGAHGPIDTDLSIAIGAGVGLGFAIMDDSVPSDGVLDDEAEVVLDGVGHPAVAFTVADNDLAVHPGDAAAVLAALAKTTSLQLHSDGAGIETGPIALDLPADALAWLQQCGRQFAIAIDGPSDPKAGGLPVPQPRSPEIKITAPTPAGPPGIEDKRKIAGWDASQLRGSDGRVLACLIRQHYGIGGATARTIATFLTASRSKGLTMLVKDSALHLPEDQKLAATLKINGKPFADFAAQSEGSDEIAIFPASGAALGLALGDGANVDFDATKVETLQFPVPSGVVPWLRACAHRWGFGFEPPASEATAKP